jgi:hypothetical protein
MAERYTLHAMNACLILFPSGTQAADGTPIGSAQFGIASGCLRVFHPIDRLKPLPRSAGSRATLDVARPSKPPDGNMPGIGKTYDAWAAPAVSWRRKADVVELIRRHG